MALGQSGSTWDENAIRDRAERLAKEAIEIWKAPSLSPDVLAKYAFNVGPRKKTYTIEDHPHLREGNSHSTAL